MSSRQCMRSEVGASAAGPCSSLWLCRDDVAGVYGVPNSTHDFRYVVRFFKHKVGQTAEMECLSHVLQSSLGACID